MQKENVKVVSRERAEKYIGFYNTIYDIDTHVQPNFWEAVIMLCENPSCDEKVTKLNEEVPYCVRFSDYGNGHISRLGVQTVFELAQKISEAIIENETTPVDPFDILQMKAKIKELESAVEGLEARHARFY